MLNTSANIKEPGLNVLPPGVERYIVNGGGLTGIQILPDDEIEIINKIGYLKTELIKPVSPLYFNDKEKTSAQDKFAKSIDALRARASLLASERSGVSFGLILQDNERQAANYRESIRQSLESARRQHTRSIQQTEAQYQNIRNQYRSQTQQAYNQIPSTGSILLGAAASGLNTYVATT